MKTKVEGQRISLEGYLLLQEIHNETSELEDSLDDVVAHERLGKIDFLVSLLMEFFDKPAK